MLESKFHKIFIGCCSSLLIAVICFAVFLKLNKVEAASNCGDVVAPGLPIPVACGCGDTILSNYTFPADLNCNVSGYALTIGASGMPGTPIVIDGNGKKFTSTNPEIGGHYGFNISNFNYITIQNLTLENFETGINVQGTGVGTPASAILIDNNIFHTQRTAINSYYIASSEISRNTFQYCDVAAFYTTRGDNLNIHDNIFDSNSYPIFGPNGFLRTSTISNNLFKKNRYHIEIDALTYGDTLSNNTLEDNAFEPMLDFNESPAGRIVVSGGTVNFDIDLFALTDRTACPTCNYVITTSPLETITSGLGAPGNKVTGNFQATRNGTYSLFITSTDPNNNITSHNYRYFVGTPTVKTATFYLNDSIPSHGQSISGDTLSFLPTPSAINDFVSCDFWTMGAMEQIPDYPLANLNSISTKIWYILNPPIGYTPSGADPILGLERYATRTIYTISDGVRIDIPQTVPFNAATYTNPQRDYTSINWTMDYPWNWYHLAVKMDTSVGTMIGPPSFLSKHDGPIWKTETGATTPSTVTLNYSITSTPAIKSISNDEINILSATQLDPTKPNNIELVVAGIGNTDIVLGDFTSPFDTHESIIYPDQTTKLELTGLAGTSTYQTINMNAVPDSGNIKVNILAWNTGAPHYKNWTEDGNLAGIVTTHTIGDLAPWTRYAINVDTLPYQEKVSNGNGVLTFIYNGGYSLKTFELVEGAFVGAPSGSSGLIFSSSAQVVINTDQPETTSENVTLTLTSTEATQMLISNDPLFDSAAWEPFTSSKAWSLIPGLGEKTVYVKLRNLMGANSPLITDSINLVAETVPVIPPETGPAPILCQDQLPEGITIGNLLKIAESKTVYFVGIDNCRHSFPNEPTYFSWFANFSEVKTTTLEIIAQIKMGKNVTIRPGTALVKIQSQPQVYLVEPGAKLRALASEALANQLYGNDWSKLVIDIPDTFFTDYQQGQAAIGYGNGSIIQYQNDNNIYYLENNKKRQINLQLFNQLFQAKYLVQNLSTDFKYEDGLIFPTTTLEEIMTW